MLRRRGAALEVAEDLLQESFLRLMKVQPGEAVRDARAYLHRTARNLMIDGERQERRSPLMHLTEEQRAAVPGLAPAADHILIAREELKRLRWIIEQLPRRQREVFTLHRLEGLSPDEIARRLGISRNMVDRHLRLALETCVERFSEP
ncbi:RNA polymerase sigma factor [Roseococcus sp. XZZS9]|uniref:RNA polymerase sigma factor n=2 Tax=Roseococcus pinisoli TaxID=2835040 RepID=A0ABS5QCW6_9PROT|nr:RNA polymerase sigma factor [Roseococcus pinisoli]